MRIMGERNLVMVIEALLKHEGECKLTELFEKHMLNGMHYRTFHRMIEVLEDSGFIETKKVSGKSKGVNRILMSIRRDKLEKKLEDVKKRIEKKCSKAASRTPGGATSGSQDTAR